MPLRKKTGGPRQKIVRKMGGQTCPCCKSFSNMGNPEINHKGHVIAHCDCGSTFRGRLLAGNLMLEEYEG